MTGDAVLVTGAGGMIGAAVLRHLVAEEVAWLQARHPDKDLVVTIEDHGLGELPFAWR